MKLKWVGKPVVREDAWEKATGRTKYMTDLTFPDMVWGKIVRAGVPHARILEIDTTEAERLSGVIAVVTYKDVPGLNGYGIAIPDQPVFCEDRVRYEGDPIAGVIAETREIAEQAAARIRIRYEGLPGVFDPREALKAEAPAIHDKGNVLLQAHVKNGDVDAAFKEAYLIVERDYYVPVQFPVYLEVEGGVAEYKEGHLTIWCGSQYPSQDQRQLSAILGIPQEKIRIISNPVGGAFGGKDDLTIQPQLAVMALKAGRPVKVVNTREESNRISWKRHPMFITMKTAVRKDGTLLANRVEVITDTGAYAGLGGPVLTNVIGHACGAYRVPNLEVTGYCVYTNNSPCSAMRGFGVPQITFAMESQMDIIAEELGLDPLEIRLKNGLVTGDKGPLGNTISTAMGVIPTLLKAKETDLWRRREVLKKQVTKPWKKRGVGIATSIKGVGLGRGIPDYSAADIILTEAGDYLVFIGCPEIGQGNHVAFAQMAAESLHCPISRVKVIMGDSSCTPDSGITAASRTIYAGGNAILLAAEEIKQKIIQFVSKYWEVPATEVYFDEYKVCSRKGQISISELALLAGKQRITIKGSAYFDMPTADKDVEGLKGLPCFVFGTVTQIALVEVDTCTGYVEVLESVCIPDAGRVINNQGLEGQAEGGTVMGMGYAIMEKGVIKDGHILTDNYDTYIIPTSLDCPDIAVYPVEELEKTGPFGAKGIAEALSTAITPAVINAIYDAVGVRIRHLPATAEKLFAGIQQQGNKN
ncbi:MAG TPA: xanthine dehydrogenase family protein molybdopterin-binding subunit [Syntrophomonadaceae bacterium]|nr:xanthine dehydrogenase family protein molybdopterin-binding subunit [Syntrophomonadaceae bacterium]